MKLALWTLFGFAVGLSMIFFTAWLFMWAKQMVL